MAVRAYTLRFITDTREKRCPFRRFLQCKRCMTFSVVDMSLCGMVHRDGIVNLQPGWSDTRYTVEFSELPGGSVTVVGLTDGDVQPSC